LVLCGIAALPVVDRGRNDPRRNDAMQVGSVAGLLWYCAALGLHRHAASPRPILANEYPASAKTVDSWLVSRIDELTRPNHVAVRGTEACVAFLKPLPVHVNVICEMNVTFGLS
jgi:hypothetical protein